MSIPADEFAKLPKDEDWVDAYQRYLEHHGFYSDIEIDKCILDAKKIIAKVPEPYHTRLLKYINTFSRDDCVCLDCILDCLDEIFP